MEKEVEVVLLQSNSYVEFNVIAEAHGITEFQDCSIEVLKHFCTLGVNHEKILTHTDPLHKHHED